MNALHMCCMRSKYGNTHLASSSTPQAASSLQLQSIHFDVTSYYISIVIGWHFQSIVWLSCLNWYLVPGIHARGAMTLPSAAKILRLSNWAKWLPNHGQTRTKIRLAIWDFESLRINHLCFLRVGSLEGINFYLNHMIDVCAKEQRQQESWGNQTTLNLA